MEARAGAADGYNAAMETSLELDRWDHVVLTVTDVERAAAFYEKLGMRRVAFGEGRMGVSFGTGGRQRIHFHEVGRVIQPRARRATVGSGDFCVISGLDVEGVQERLGGYWVFRRSSARCSGMGRRGR